MKFNGENISRISDNIYRMNVLIRHIGYVLRIYDKNLIFFGEFKHKRMVYHTESVIHVANARTVHTYTVLHTSEHEY